MWSHVYWTSFMFISVNIISEAFPAMNTLMYFLSVFFPKIHNKISLIKNLAGRSVDLSKITKMPWPQNCTRYKFRFSYRLPLLWDHPLDCQGSHPVDYQISQGSILNDALQSGIKSRRDLWPAKSCRGEIPLSIEPYWMITGFWLSIVKRQ